MNVEVKYKMTNKIAFDLGKLDFPCFYQFVIWKINREPFPYYRFFDWKVGGVFGGVPINDNREVLWEEINVHGSLRTSEIETLEHKLWYVRGRLKSYSVQIEPKKISVSYANSQELRDFTAQAVHELCWDFSFAPQKSGEIGRSLKSPTPYFTVTKNEWMGTVPACPSFSLEADEEVIKYILGDGKEPE